MFKFILALVTTSHHHKSKGKQLNKNKTKIFISKMVFIQVYHQSAEGGTQALTFLFKVPSDTLYKVPLNLKSEFKFEGKCYQSCIISFVTPTAGSFKSQPS